MPHLDAQGTSRRREGDPYGHIYIFALARADRGCVDKLTVDAWPHVSQSRGTVGGRERKGDEYRRGTDTHPRVYVARMFRRVERWTSLARVRPASFPEFYSRDARPPRDGI